jgi:hypothetical protein
MWMEKATFAEQRKANSIQRIEAQGGTIPPPDLRWIVGERFGTR